MRLPLEKIRVLDLSRFAAGPICTMLLADMGAEVIRIEPPEGGADRFWALIGPDGENLMYKAWARNKKGITLRLNTEKGMMVFRELVNFSDVVIHNFVPGSGLASDLTYDNLSKTNPKIIVAAVSGYGQYGPYAKKLCFDHNAQARAGSIMLDGFPGGPPLKTTVPYVDFSTGTATAAGILLALHYREKTGMGQLVDVALFDVACAINQSMATLMLYKVYGETREHLGNSGFSTYMCCVQAKDGMVLISPATDAIWKKFAKAIGRDDLISDHRFKHDMDRYQNTNIIDEIVNEWARERTVEEILATLEEKEVPCAPVNASDQLLSDPQVKAREMITEINYPGVGKLPVQGVPIKLSKAPAQIVNPAPKIGEHNLEVYSTLLGFNAEKLSELKQEGII